MTKPDPTDTVDLTNCDREPIHIPGSIQPHGILFACDPDLSIVRRHSRNVADELGQSFGLPATHINGQSLEKLIGAPAVHALRNALAKTPDPTRPGLLPGMVLANGARADVAVHVFAGVAIVEIEKAEEDAAHAPLELTRQLVGRLGQLTGVDALVRHASRILRFALGYDRVMIYRFAHDGSGQVISESKRSDLESFLGQHFPASDIPRQARVLYLQNTIRIVSDANCIRIAIDPVFDAAGAALDLSYAHLRSVSPIHCEYLRNMGVGASMSISIIVGGELWGLIACHHYAPRTLSMSQRMAAEMFGEFFSLHLDALSHKQKVEIASKAKSYLDKLLVTFSRQGGINEILEANLAQFHNLIQCDGSALWIDGQWHAHGATPPENAVPALIQTITTLADGRIWSTHTLSDAMPAAHIYKETASGVLAIPLSQLPRDYLLLFRREFVQTIDWAGDPNKKYETGPLGDRLTPRKSFAIWKESVERQSARWSPSDLDIAEALRSSLIEVILRHNEMLAEERQKAEVRQKMLNEELNHRVKNILALIKSLVSRPVEAADDLSDYVASLKGRIQALAIAHDQVIRGDGGGSLQALLNAELSPYHGNAGTILVEGPDASLDARAFSVMALVLHELATNAAKYGALSVKGGKLIVRWQRLQNDDCDLTWTETDGPPVTPPRRQGFGSTLITRSIPYDLGGESKIDYASEGVRTHFRLPAQYIAWQQSEPTPQPAAAGAASQAGTTIAGLNVLLVEDQLLIALDVENMLTDEKVAAVETCASTSEALRALSTFMPDVAILDINLGNGTSFEIAAALLARAVPFVFATGYGDNAVIPENLRQISVVRKPYDKEALVTAVLSAARSAK